MTNHDFDADLDRARQQYAEANPDAIAARTAARESDEQWDAFIEWWLDHAHYYDRSWPEQGLIINAWVADEGGFLGLGATKVYEPVAAHSHVGRVFDYAVQGYDYGDQPARALLTDRFAVFPFDQRGVPESMLDEYYSGFGIPREDRETVRQALLAELAARTEV